MRRNRFSLRINAEYANLFYSRFRQSKHISSTSSSEGSPDEQTFLLSPTPSGESFRLDSPVLPGPYRKHSSVATNASNVTILSSSVETFHTMADEVPNSQLTNTGRMEDILPDNKGLYTEDDFRDWDWSIDELDKDTTQQQHGVDADVSLGPEVRGSLPVIHDEDFPYYPLPSGSSSPSKAFEGEERTGVKENNRQLAQEKVRGFGLMKFFKCLFRRYGVKKV